MNKKIWKYEELRTGKARHVRWYYPPEDKWYHQAVFGKHLRSIGSSYEEYYIKFILNLDKKPTYYCDSCGKVLKFKGLTLGYGTVCNRSCKGKKGGTEAAKSDLHVFKVANPNLDPVAVKKANESRAKNKNLQELYNNGGTMSMNYERDPYWSSRHQTEFYKQGGVFRRLMETGKYQVIKSDQGTRVVRSTMYTRPDGTEYKCKTLLERRLCVVFDILRDLNYLTEYYIRPDYINQDLPRMNFNIILPDSTEAYVRIKSGYGIKEYELLKSYKDEFNIVIMDSSDLVELEKLTIDYDFNDYRTKLGKFPKRIR